MSRTTHLRKSLSPYQSARIIDLPKFNSPGTGSTISGDQYHTSLKTFSEYLILYGTDNGSLQSPSGNLYINGRNIGGYEYVLYNASIQIGPQTYGNSTNSDLNCFVLCKGTLTVAGSIEPATSTKSKRTFVIYATESITTSSTTPGQYRFYNYAPANTFSDQIPIVDGVVSGTTTSYVYRFPRLVAGTTSGVSATPGVGGSGTASPATLITGSNGNPSSALLGIGDGLLYGGSGGGGGGITAGSTAVTAGSGSYASSVGGGGGGEGAYNNTTSPGGGTIKHSGGNARSVDKPGYTTAGAGGSPLGTSIVKDGGDTAVNSGIAGSGGVIVAFCGLNFNTNVYLNTQAGYGPSYNVTYAGGGGAGGGPIFLMTSDNVSNTTHLNSAGGSAAGGNTPQTTAAGGSGAGGSGIAMKSNSNILGRHRWYI